MRRMISIILTDIVFDTNAINTSFETIKKIITVPVYRTYSLKRNENIPKQDIMVNGVMNISIKRFLMYDYGNNERNNTRTWIDHLFIRTKSVASSIIVTTIFDHYATILHKF